MGQNLVDLEQAGHPLHPFAYALGSLAPRRKRTGDIVEGIHMRKERKVLERHPDVPQLGRDVAHVPAVEAHGAAVRFYDAGDQAQKNRLAGPRGSEEDQCLPLRDGQEARHPP